ncbi:MAG: dethiobiotin synthase [Thermoproteota archaeon]|nr:dethiobiotin synthase [Thermoproteota archaeon]
MNVKGLFVIGTDTNVGKTIISAAIAWKLSSKVKKICISKPFATANTNFSKRYKSKDLYILCKSISIMEEESLLNPYFYKLAGSPYMASEILKEKKPSLRNALKKYKILKEKYDFLVMEGIGGLMVPITQRTTLLDFIKMTGLSTVIVTTPRIGTLNHTLMTVKICQYNNVPIQGIVVNKMPAKAGIIERKTPQYIEKITKIPILGIVPHIKNLKVDENLLRTISEKIAIELGN